MPCGLRVIACVYISADAPRVWPCVRRGYSTPPPPKQFEPILHGSLRASPAYSLPRAGECMPQPMPAATVDARGIRLLL
jgi:hypothetical protein